MSIPTCKLCKTLGLPGAKFCGACGTPYGESGPAAPDASDALFGSIARSSSEADLDDLFSSLPSPPEEEGGPAQGAATQLFMDAVTDAEGTGLFASTGGPGLEQSNFVASPGASRKPEEVDDLGDLFGGGDGGDSLDDLFGSKASIDPDRLFEATGTTGMQAAVPAGGDLGDLFGSLPEPDPAPPPPPPPAPNPSQSAETVISQGPEDPTLEFSAFDREAPPPPPSTDDLFAAPPPSGALFDPPAGDDDLFAEPGSGEAPFDFQPPPGTPSSADDLFSGDPDDATLDISMSSHMIQAPEGMQAPGPAMGDLFEPESVSTDGAVFGQTVPDLHDVGVEELINLAADEVGEETMRHLVDDQEDVTNPAVPGLEDGDLLAEAHLVADVGGRSFSPESTEQPEPGPHDDAVPPRPRDRRAQRPRVMFTTLPPDPGWIGRAAGLAGVLVASLVTAMALRHDPRAAALTLPLMTMSLAIATGVAYFVALLVLKTKLSAEFFSRVLALGTLAFAYTQVAPASLGIGDPAAGMLLCILLGVGAVLWSHVLFLSLRISLGIVGVYSGLSLLTSLSQGIPYPELVTRRILEAPGLSAHLAPDRLALLLKGFDPLFLAVNLFLPLVVLLGVLEALYDLKKRWWGPAGVRLLQCLLTGAAVYLNLQLYQKMQVPNLLSLLGMG